ncbi:MAG: hypothetical protein AB7E51_00300 [Pseudodesulfovibrio sp.]|uniref:hypothetical protein n=1 Tax=Pseudodesulfovibrio sp. TaxID=2035812 RepID=UPI003D10CF8D
MNILSTLTGSVWKKVAVGLALTILVAVLVGVAAWKGYRAGYAAADLKRRAEVADIRAGHAKALADAEALARHALEAATARSNALEAEYLAARKTINRQSRELTKARIANASRDHIVVADGTVRVSPEWVRLYNEAIGAGPGDGGRALPGAAPSAAGAAGTAGAADAGVLRGGAAVTLADILAHVRDYGARGRAIEAQLNALIDWAEGLPEVEHD